MKPGIALITGAGKRVGRAMALHLAARGWDIAVHYMSSVAEADAVVAEARALGVRAAAFRADLTDAAETDVLVPQVVAKLGQVTLLVNNASIFEYDTVSRATRESWHRHASSNLEAPFFLTQAVAAQAPEAGRDEDGEPVARTLVVNMLDQRIRKLTPEFMTYTLAKMGLWAFTRTAAQGLAPAVRVMGIGPGPTLQGGRQSAEHFAAQRAATPLGRGTSPAEICGALDFIIASPGLTGQVICLDGGQHLAWATPDVLGVE
ncbi:SDR family oxidoreductase [Paroceanicella profunda]|uniref:SDR family oxidoreductase n=1 Tax=Paroceanicella profunda TaxID=2579971 RepID=A0A5B8FHS2_9RHOB|nr:SDR family oxidoreductase [Paroceanicella profunda]QDL92298.1 SDR family oxidoreductase [Paroceanicella profunda]